MRILQNISNVTAPSSDYPGGRIRNRDESIVPITEGTPIVEEIYGDIIQYFQRLKTLGGVTENNLPDNVTNGFQLVEALFSSIISQLKATGVEAAAGTLDNKFVTPASLSATTEGILTGKFNIGAYNLQSSAVFTYPFTLLPFEKFISAEAWIINDAQTNSYHFTSAGVIEDAGLVSGQITTFKNGTGTDINLFRRGGGFFDSASFSSLANNRGYIIVKYLP